MDWSSFYLAAAAAAATLIGLLFIAVQFNIEAFASDPGNRWRAIARSTFAIYGTLFFLPMFMLIPNLTNVIRGEVNLVITAIGILQVTTTWLPVWRGMFHRRVERLWQTVWLLIGPLLAYLTLASSANDMVQGSISAYTQMNIAFVIMGLFALALRNSWNLLVELRYERKAPDKETS
jgi:hypothetical protein